MKNKNKAFIDKIKTLHVKTKSAEPICGMCGQPGEMVAIPVLVRITKPKPKQDEESFAA